ncbi:MAG: ferritin family protein [Chloroflexi bacterium]|nr:ferritin family protein [Chloroflexota bacterium]
MILTSRQAISYAEARENICYRLYKDAAGICTDPFIKVSLEEIAEDEKKHKAVLSEFDPSKLGEEGKVDLSTLMVDIDDPDPPGENAKLIELIKFAIWMEEEDNNYYRFMRDKTTDKETRRLFELLATEERAHKTRLEKMLEELEPAGTYRQ